jgi:hypothetical protein
VNLRFQLDLNVEVEVESQPQLLVVAAPLDLTFLLAWHQTTESFAPPSTSLGSLANHVTSSVLDQLPILIGHANDLTGGGVDHFANLIDCTEGAATTSAAGRRLYLCLYLRLLLSFTTVAVAVSTTAWCRDVAASRTFGVTRRLTSSSSSTLPPRLRRCFLRLGRL